MPEKIGKPLERKTEAQKKADEQLIKDITEDPTSPPPDFDPLESQAAALPESIKGSEGNKEHAVPVDGDSDVEGGFSSAEADEEFEEDDDPSTLTA
jgi:hypothetical protein